MFKYKIALSVFGSIVLLAMIYLINTPYWTALTKSKSHFIENTNNPKVFYEKGALEYSDEIANHLSSAIERVEAHYGGPFLEPCNVYVCSSQQSFNEFIGEESLIPVRGISLMGDILIAPSAFNFQNLDTHKETLTHELSHLFFRQKVGLIRYRKIPHWFHEGYADFIASSGGEGIEESVAVAFILSGRHFILDEGGDFFYSYSTKRNGLSGPMFHKQAKMFVAYIVNTDSVRFKTLISKIQEGESFSLSFKDVMQTDVQGMWRQFTSHLEIDSLRSKRI